MKIVFHGACQTVTGSQHEIQLAGKRILLDCGLFQGPREEARRINCCFDFDPKTVHAVVLSHGHIDHVGNLPNLVKQGFSGPIYATPATIAISAFMLLDSAKIQEENAGYLHKKFHPNPAPPVVEPLYTVADAQETIKRFQPLEYRTPTDLGGYVVEFHDAGHILGSACVCVREFSDGIAKRSPSIFFTGDVGRPNSVILNNPDPFTESDVLISECTYGGRLHTPVAQIPLVLARVINETINRNGVVIIPAFALGGTQTLIYYLRELVNQKKLPADLPVFVDSPLATHLTDVFKTYGKIMDDQARALAHPFDFPNLHYVAGVEESRALNDRRTPCVIVASSGMCESGRVLHHLKHHIADSRTTVLIAGYQAQQTLGRKMQEGYRSVPILGEMIPLRAHVESIDGLSSHADENELLAFVAPLRNKPPRTFLVHGEMDSARAHQAALEAQNFSQIFIPQRGDTVEV